jgi:CBS domain-containing protein
MKWSFSFVRVFEIDIKIHATFGLILLLGAMQWGGSNGFGGAAFIFLGAGQEWAAERARAVLTTFRVGDAYNKHALTLSPADRVSTVVNLLLTSYQPDFAVVQGDSLLGVVTREHVLRALLSDTEDLYVTGIMDREVPRFQDSAELDTIRNEMAANGKQVGAIFDGEKYLGLVSQEDIREALLVATFVDQREKRRLARAGAA